MKTKAIALVGTVALFAGGCAHVSPRQLREKGAAVTRPRCNAVAVLEKLSKKPQDDLSGFDRAIDIVTNQFKRMGIYGWTDTGCNATAVGVSVRDSRSSSSGFYTIDVALTSFRVKGLKGPPDRFVRIEIAPGTGAHRVADKGAIKKGMTLAFAGPVLIDHDGPFLEVHPGARLRIVRGSLR